MPPTNYPNGVSSFGMPVFGAGPLIPTTTGNVFYVHSVTGSDYNDGLDVSAPLATVDAAINKCTASKGDVIICLPLHAETVTATSIALDIANVTVVGLGLGATRPTFTFGAAAATITVTGAASAWRNCRFVANFADVAAAVTIGAAKDVEISGNAFLDTDSTHNFLSAVVTGATNNDADGLNVIGNTFDGAATTQNAFVSILANEKRVVLAQNYVNKAATNNAGHFVTLSSKIMSGIRILGNILNVVGATTATVGIFGTGSGTTSTGTVAYNLVSSLDTTTELLFTASTNLQFFENYYTGTADASGKLWPVVDAA